MAQDERPLDEQLRELRPVHAAVEDGSVKVKRLPGRPVRARVRPTFEQTEYVQKLRDLRHAWVDADETVGAISDGTHGAPLLRRIASAIARESAALAFDREQASRNEAVEDLTARRIDSLLQLGRVELALSKLEFGSLDPHDERMQRVFESFVDVLNAAAEVTLGAEMAGRFVEAFRSSAAGWEDGGDLSK